MKARAVRLWILASLLQSAHLAAQDTLIFSSIDHPTVENYLKPLVVSAYRSLGYKIEIVRMTEERANISISEGLIDGAIIKAELVTRIHPNIILVPPNLVTVGQYLICRTQRPCTLEAMLKTHYPVHMVVAVNKQYDWPAQLNAITMSSMDSLTRLYNHSRIDNMIFPFVSDQSLMDTYPNASFQLQFRHGAYHVLSPNHRSLVPLVTAQLEQQIRANPLSIKKGP